MRSLWVWVFLAIGAGPGAAAGDDPVVAVLEGRCLECHHKASSKGGLDLSTREALLKGGETGLAIVGTDPDKSPLRLLARSNQRRDGNHRRYRRSPDELRTLT